MIKIYTQTTHSKFSYSEDPESLAIRKLLLTKFIANNTQLENDPRVRNGYMSSYENFYNEEHDILPTGLIPYVFEILEEEKAQFEHIELRKFPGVNKTFLKKLINDEISFTGKDGVLRTPRDYQKNSLLKVVKNKGGIINLPVGSGKTLLSAVLPYIYNCKILYLFDSIDLIHQTYRNFVDDYEISENDISIIQGENYKYDNKNNIILLSIKSYEKAFHIFPQVKIIVYDECHSSGRTELSQRITYSCQNASIHIGLSATPDRIKNPAEQLRLYANIGPIIYQKKILEQMEGNHISELEVNLYSMSLPNDDMIEVTGSYNDIYEKVKLNREMIKQAMKELFNITLKKTNEMIKTYYDDDKRVDEVDEAIEYLIKKIKEEDDNNEVVKEDGIYYLRKFMKYGDESTHYILNDLRNNKIAEIAKKNKRVLILYNKIKHGEELKKRLPEAYLIHGKDSQEVRKEAEDYLRNNENAIVISSKIWNKGKDIPAIENYINAGGGVSEIEQIQKMGRVVRVSKDTGKGIAYVHDFEDKFSPLAIKQSNIRKRVYIKEGLNIIYHK